MSFDGAFTHAMVHELNNILSTSRVNKINQPYDNEIVLTMRAKRKSYSLLLSANPEFPRIQTSIIPYVNPAVPTKFTMMLRKHLSGSVLKSISQLDNDRVVKLNFSNRNEIGDKVSLQLIIEIMSRHSNIILLDPNQQVILDVIKHVGVDQNRYRTLLPGNTYINPPYQDLFNPFNGAQSDLNEKIIQFPNENVLADELRHQYQGLGKDTSLALARFLHGTGDPILLFKDFFNIFDHPLPTMLNYENGNTNYAPFNFNVPNTTTTTFNSLSELLDFYYQDRAESVRVQQQGSILINVIRNELKKNKSKLKKLLFALDNAGDANDYRIKGELLTAYAYRITIGMTEVVLPNFYNNEKPLKIKLSNQISPSKNAQKYFKKYNKLKTSVYYVREQIKKTENEINYFESILSQIELAAPKDLFSIRLELQQEGYIRIHHKKKSKKNQQKVSKPEKFTASDGIIIEVGKNNLQNDQLTLHSAAKTDIWLHVKNMPGSHVIVHDSNPSDKTLYEAAKIAAYYSKARLSSSVPVDYVQVKKIRKPHGAKPGFVIYDDQRTIYVTPMREEVEKLSN